MDLIAENSFYSTDQEKLDFLANREALITSFYVNVFGTLGLYKMDSKKTRMLQYYIGDKRLQLRSINDENNDTSLIVKLMVDEGLLRTQVANKITRFLVIMKRRPDASTIDEDLIREWLKESRYNVNRPAMRLLPAIRKFADGEYTLPQLSVAMWNFLRRNKDFAAYNKEFMNIAVQYRQLMNKVVKADAEDSENAEVGVTQADGSVIKVGSTRKINEPLVQKRKYATDVDLNQVDVKEVFNTLFHSFDVSSDLQNIMLKHLERKGGLLFDGYQNQDIDTVLKDYFDYDKLYSIVKDRFNINKLFDYIVTNNFSLYDDRNKEIFSSLAITTIHKQDKRFEDFRNQVLARYVAGFIIEVSVVDGFEKVIASEYRKIQTREIDNLIIKDIGELNDLDIRVLLDYIRESFTPDLLLQKPGELRNIRLSALTKILKTINLDEAIINYLEPVSKRRADIELLYMYCSYTNAVSVHNINNPYLGTLFSNHNLKFSDKNIYTQGINNHPELVQTLLNNKELLYYTKNLVVDDYEPDNDLHPALWHFLTFENTESNQDRMLFYELGEYTRVQAKNVNHFDGLIESLEKNYDALSNTSKNKLFMVAAAAFIHYYASYTFDRAHPVIPEYIKFFEDRFNFLDSNNTNFLDKVRKEKPTQAYLIEGNLLFKKWRKEIIELELLNFFPELILNSDLDLNREILSEYGEDRYLSEVIQKPSSRVIASAAKYTVAEVNKNRDFPLFWNKVVDSRNIYAVNLLQSPKFLNWVANNKFKSGNEFFVHLTRSGSSVSYIDEVIANLSRIENVQTLPIHSWDDFVSDDEIKYNAFDFTLIETELEVDALLERYLKHANAPIFIDILGRVIPNFKTKALKGLQEGDFRSVHEFYEAQIWKLEDDQLDKKLRDIENTDPEFFKYIVENYVDKYLESDTESLSKFWYKGDGFYDVKANKLIKLLNISSYKDDSSQGVTILNNFIEEIPNKHKLLEINRIIEDDSLNEQTKSEFYNQLKLGPRRDVAQKLYSKSYFEKAYKQLMSESAVIKPYKMPSDISKYLKLNNILDDSIEDNDVVITKSDIKAADIRTYDDLQSFIDPDNIQEVSLEPLAVEPIDESEEELELKTVEYDVFNKYAHGNGFGVKFLRSFNVDIPIQREQNKLWAKELEIEGKSSEVMERVFHGTGSIGASFILRSGFAVSKDLIKAGRMLGDGIYFTNVLDKASLYVGDESYLRRPGNVTGYILEMKVSLGEKGVDYTDGQDRNLVSPEWVCYRPNYQCTVYRAHEVELVSKSELDELKTKHQINEGFIPMKNFSEYITERTQRSKLRSEPNRKGMVYTFKDEYIPTPKGLVHYKKWRSPNKDVVLSGSAWGPTITIYNDTQSGVLAVLDSREFENSSEGREFINLAYRR